MGTSENHAGLGMHLGRISGIEVVAAANKKSLVDGGAARRERRFPRTGQFIQRGACGPWPSTWASHLGIALGRNASLSKGCQHQYHQRWRNRIFWIF